MNKVKVAIATLFLVGAAAARAQFPVSGGPSNLGAEVTTISDSISLQLSIAKLYPRYPTIVFSQVTMVPYLAGRLAGGVMVPGREWHGTVILRSDEGDCLKVVRDNFKLATLEGIQLPSFKGVEVSVGCPTRVGN